VDGLARDPASFRDPDGAVHDDGIQVLRTLSERSAHDWARLRDTQFFRAALEEGRLVATEEASAETVPSSVSDGWALTLRHERLPFVSYPYEWTFSMLQDAALIHLELLSAALNEGFSMKDGSAFNVQFKGSTPIFIDLGSFEPSVGPWAGYRQFCQTLLYPLLLAAHRGIDFRPLLRGRIEGIEPDQMQRLVGFRDRLRPGVFKHVVLHAAMAGRMTERSARTKAELQEAGFGADLTAALARGLRKTVKKLVYRPPRSHWSDYHQIAIYGEDDRAAKETFVRQAVPARTGLVLDLGCNDGTYSVLIADAAEYVVAVDSDPVVVDRLYRLLRANGPANVLPLVIDLADPSPGMGWRGRERPSFCDRARPEAVLALALVHHLAIGASVPLDEVVAWLRSFDARVVAEFPLPGDPFVERLMANKPTGTHTDYTLETFERAVASRFAVRRRQALPCGSRILFELTP